MPLVIQYFFEFLSILLENALSPFVKLKICDACCTKLLYKNGFLFRNVSFISKTKCSQWKNGDTTESKARLYLFITIKTQNNLYWALQFSFFSIFLCSLSIFLLHFARLPLKKKKIFFKSFSCDIESLPTFPAI